MGTSLKLSFVHPTYDQPAPAAAGGAASGANGSPPRKSANGIQPLALTPVATSSIREADSSEHKPKRAKLALSSSAAHPTPASTGSVDVESARDRLRELQRASKAWEKDAMSRYSEEAFLAIDCFHNQQQNEFNGHARHNSPSLYAEAVAQDTEGRLRAEAAKGWALSREIELIWAKHPQLVGWQL
jgi:hypothetical protein